MAADLWGKDQTGLKVRERLDCQAIDEEAIVKAVIPTEPKKYTNEELAAMTIDQIKAIAQERGYNITKTVKEEIITEFIAQQG